MLLRQILRLREEREVQLPGDGTPGPESGRLEVKLKIGISLEFPLKSSWIRKNRKK
jgi:hypothetical protein